MSWAEMGRRGNREKSPKRLIEKSPQRLIDLKNFRIDGSIGLDIFQFNNRSVSLFLYEFHPGNHRSCFMKVEYDLLKQHFHLFLLRIERGDVFRRRTGK